MIQEQSALARTLFHALRHAPEHYFLELDAEGWTVANNVLLALRYARPEWSSLEFRELHEFIDSKLSDRIEFVGERIRAKYGHSMAMRAVGAVAAPPSLLYHGTSAAAHCQVLSCGLHRMGRTYVHLTSAIDYAREVAASKGRWYVVLEIATKRARQAGIPFYQANAHVWLADEVPAHCIRLAAPRNAPQQDDTVSKTCY